MTADCGHACCDERADPFHDHFLAPDACGACRTAGADADVGTVAPLAEEEQ